ncbi:NUDIX domain-containing protein [Jeotgalibacillus sp. R-1-5s-1]|uniref:NUDIX hydrolase n=1 Tax=Jeotgalibacillus sp. R-1-5s-1 TaxID=2555897 RepID=UPI00106C5574|nr:NUDIX domain-containing protein [Jeotgalibacillus sp. R-1-5s-1]TFD94368.1 NUDIX domain-containing protein [Jeotgalibacillus sp. R-1-5s-1]
MATEKVLSYILRNKNNNWQLLVFSQTDAPEAGIQIPGGTVESSDESLTSTMMREIEEETGLNQNLHLLEKILFEYYYHPIKQEFQKRHFFLVLLEDEGLDRWRHIVKSTGQDEGMEFNYFWMDLESDIRLAGYQHVGVGHVRDYVKYQLKK